MHGVTADQPFELEIAGTGQRIPVPASTTALEALERAGIRLRYACRLGVCGACRTRVVTGVPLHRDDALSDAERHAGQVFLPCCSRAATPKLVIALDRRA
jgi:vanillate monooxygenase ferredoxin subunit